MTILLVLNIITFLGAAWLFSQTVRDLRKLRELRELQREQISGEIVVQVANQVAQQIRIALAERDAETLTEAHVVEIARAQAIETANRLLSCLHEYRTEYLHDLGRLREETVTAISQVIKMGGAMGAEFDHRVGLLETLFGLRNLLPVNCATSEAGEFDEVIADDGGNADESVM
jgi:hypothetical protein